MPKLIVGLGNPGKEYERTRHNAGFIAIDVLLDKYGFDSQENNFKGILYSSRIKNQKVFFLKPQTYMNLSGESIIQVMNFYKIDIEDVFIIYDDKDLEVATTRFRPIGTAGGHNGIKNIINHFKTESFKRLKIGVGRPTPGFKIVDWVLSKMSDDEIESIKNSINKVSNFVNDFVSEEPFLKIMNEFN